MASLYKNGSTSRVGLRSRKKELNHSYDFGFEVGAVELLKALGPRVPGSVEGFKIGPRKGDSKAR
jgi:hypothetical protein